MSDQRKARAAYDKLSPGAKLRIAEAGVDVMRGGPRSTELSNLAEFRERDSRGMGLSHTRVDPRKVVSTEELVKSGLAYLPTQTDKEKLSYVVLTPLGEATAVLAAKSDSGPRAEAEAEKYAALDKVCAHLTGALHYLKDGIRMDEFRCFSSEERRTLAELDRETRVLRSKVMAFRDRFGSGQDRPKHSGPSVRPGRKGRRFTRSERS